MKVLLLGAFLSFGIQAATVCPEIAGIFKCQIQKDSGDAKTYNIKMETFDSLSGTRVFVYTGKKSDIYIEGEELLCTSKSVIIQKDEGYKTKFIFTPESNELVKMEAITINPVNRDGKELKSITLCNKISEIR
jgi:hypothetical protein